MMHTASATITLDNGRRVVMEADYLFEPADPWDWNNGPGGPAGVEIEAVRIGGVPAALTEGQIGWLRKQILRDAKGERSRP